MEFIWILLAIIGIIVIMYIGFYNRVKRLNIEMQEASSGIDVALSKRFALIPNLVNTVKGYMEHEKRVLELVVTKRNEALINRDTYNEQMNEVVNRVLAIAEAYPDLKADTQFLNLQKALVDVEEHLQAARRLLNRKVAELNTAISTFPGTLFNATVKMKPGVFFEAEAAEHALPIVDLQD
ncbi:LemA family protein [Erysipelothrix sp. HDW6C]|uniref:LemA family protein n=1 Tax=Erysipelothrix sp. HDW6C TaxID=2714930 RepID=UPI00140AB9B0|nr:LemA family protein [Erysipelothrix sp. HDW6C]QIK70600.1 LemA family protein [Erysipelothrix sp. HDW6C]